MKTKLWLGIGSAVLAGSLLTTTENNQSTTSTFFGASSVYAQEGGEGGEGGGGAVTTYAIASTDSAAFQYDAKPQIEAYVELVRDSYGKAKDGTSSLKSAVDAFLIAPNDVTLAAARKAWVDARPAYLMTEAYRFYDGPIEELEGFINAWPMNEAAIDYVEGDLEAGIINNSADPITVDTLVSANQAKDEGDVTTGWHAVEFLLWGQDLSLDGPGKRPASDYTAGTQTNDRRRAYLSIVTTQLDGDIKKLLDSWEDPNGYSATFMALEQREAIGRIMNGISILAGFEFKSERLSVALDSGDQEDEHSCFSDTTHQDFVYDLAGIKAVWNGNGAGKDRLGIDELVRSIDKATADQVDALLADSETKIAALGNPWDRVLATAIGSPERKVAEEAAASLQALAKGLTDAGAKLGVIVLVPTG
jgi:putative iron-regulated protein